MILVHETRGGWQRWTGAPNVDLRRVEKLVTDGIWTDADLAKYGVEVAETFTVPEGKRTVGSERFEHDGKVVRQVFEVEDIPPPPEPDPPGVPQTITPLQARKALRAAGLHGAVTAYVASLPEDQQEEWEYAIEVRRDNLIIAAGAVMLELSDEQVDDLFRLGEML